MRESESLMPNYQTKPEHDFRYKTIAEAEGEECIVCHAEEGIHNGPPKCKLIIEHADNDRTNWAWNNIHLCCYSHNKLMEKWSTKEKKEKLKRYSDLVERERERIGFRTWATVLNDLISYEGASTEIQLHRKYYKDWKKFIFEEIEKYGSMDKTALINAAATAAHCSQQTSRNYLGPETAYNALLEEKVGPNGNKIIVFRERVVTRPQAKKKKPSSPKQTAVQQAERESPDSQESGENKPAER